MGDGIVPISNRQGAGDLQILANIELFMMQHVHSSRIHPGVNYCL